VPSHGRGRVARRPVEWLGFESGLATDTVDSTSVSQVITDSQFSEYIHPTIVRVRGIFSVVMAGNIVNGTVVPAVTVGLTVVTRQAALAAAVPAPGADLDADWLWWEKFSPDTNEGTLGESLYMERVVDSKAMRRINQPDNAMLVMVFQTGFNGQTGTIRFTTTLRILIKGD